MMTSIRFGSQSRIFLASTGMALLAAAVPPAIGATQETSGYNQPPKNILDVLHAPSPPSP